LYGISITLAILLLAATVGGVTLVATGVFRAPPIRTVQLASPPQNVKGDGRATFPFPPALPGDKDWTVRIRLTVTPTDQASGCTYGAQVTAHVEADGVALPSFTSQPGQTVITRSIHLGRRGDRSLQLIVTRIATDPECVLQLSPAGSQAAATG